MSSLANTPPPAQGADEIEHILASAFQDGFGAAHNPKYRNRTVEHTERIMKIIHRERLKGALDELKHVCDGEGYTHWHDDEHDYACLVSERIADLTRQLEELESGDAA